MKVLYSTVDYCMITDNSTHSTNDMEHNDYYKTWYSQFNTINIQVLSLFICLFIITHYSTHINV